MRRSARGKCQEEVSCVNIENLGAADDAPEAAAAPATNSEGHSSGQ